MEQTKCITTYDIKDKTRTIIHELNESNNPKTIFINGIECYAQKCISRVHLSGVCCCRHTPLRKSFTRSLTTTGSRGDMLVDIGFIGGNLRNISVFESGLSQNRLANNIRPIYLSHMDSACVSINPAEDEDTLIIIETWMPYSPPNGIYPHTLSKNNWKYIKKSLVTYHGSVY